MPSGVGRGLPVWQSRERRRPTKQRNTIDNESSEIRLNTNGDQIAIAVAEIPVTFRTDPNNYEPYARDDATLARLAAGA